MTDQRKRMVADFGRDLSRRVEEVMQRQTDIAQHVFTGVEITEIILKVTVGINLAAIMVVLQQRKDDITPADLFDLTADAIAKDVRRKKVGLDSILALVEEFQRTGARR
jgi:hypothetical protein